MSEKICMGWRIADFCCFLSYKDSKDFPFFCDVHQCEAWDCFTDSPPPGGDPCLDCQEMENAKAERRAPDYCAFCGQCAPCESMEYIDVPVVDNICERCASVLKKAGGAENV